MNTEKYHLNLLILAISAEGLERVSPSVKMETYAVVSISGGDKRTTAVDTVGDTNPTWNIPISFKVDAASQILVVELRCCDPTGGGSDKDIGQLLVQVKHLMDSVQDNNLTYQIQSGNSKAKLTLMYKWASEKVLQPATAAVQVQQQPEHPKNNKWGWFGRFLGRLCAAAGRLCAAAVIDDVITSNAELNDFGV